jgi:dihydroorotate dehydrogenase (NAD+) catalytic subunit
VNSHVRVGSVELTHPVMAASGTAGHGAELSAYGALDSIGAIVVKSIAATEWAGNPAPRVHPIAQGMINAVGLQGLGVQHWIEHDLPAMAAVNASAVVSIWGRSVDEYRQAAQLLQDGLERSPHRSTVIAVEVNLSCPNMHGHGIFAHDIAMSAEVMDACSQIKYPLWAKLSPNTDRVIAVAQAVHEAGAEAVTLINTVVGMVLDPATGRPALGNGGGGISGRAIHPVAVRTVFDVHAALPNLPIVGVGGVTSGWEAAELMLAGASAVQVGTATFADPRACFKIASELTMWAQSHGTSDLTTLSGLAHRGGFTQL